jgi:hypothetical protein
MNAETRLNKRIEIAAKLMSALLGSAFAVEAAWPYTPKHLGVFCIDCADAIIDTAIGDMTDEIKEGAK